MKTPRQFLTNALCKNIVEYAVNNLTKEQADKYVKNLLAVAKEYYNKDALKNEIIRISKAVYKITNVM